MSKHRVVFYPPNSTLDFDYADNASSGVLLNHRPMKGDVVILIEDGLPWTVVEIEQLILLVEQYSPDETSYWHAYCKTIPFDFSAIPYYGKRGDLGKLAAHAVDQRVHQIHRYGPPPTGRSMEEYRYVCREAVERLFEEGKEG